MVIIVFSIFISFHYLSVLFICLATKYICSHLGDEEIWFA